MDGINLQNVYDRWQSSGAFIQSVTNSAPFTALFESVGKYRQYAVSAQPMYMDIVTTLLRLTSESDIEPTHQSLSTDQYYVGASNLWDIAIATIQRYGTEVESGEYEGDSILQATIAGGYALQLRADPLEGVYLDLYQGDSGSPVAVGAVVTKMYRDGVPYTRVYKHPLSRFGYDFSYEDLVRDFIAQTELLKYISIISQAAMTGGLSLAWLQQLRSEVTVVYSDVREYIDRVISAYSAGGFKSALAAILGWAKSAASVSTDENGLLVFTDNSAMAPSTYIVGFLNQILSALTAVATLIVSIFNRILGAVLSVLGSVLWGVIGSIAGDYTQRSFACMNPSDKAFLAWSPLACARTEGWIPSDCEVAAAILEQGMCVVTLPFGYVLCGLAQLPSAQSPGEILVRLEFHPSIMDCGDAADAVARTYATFSHIEEGTLDPHEGWGFTLTSPETMYAPAVLETLKQALEQHPPVDPELFNSGTSGALSSADDSKLRRIITQNMGMGQLFILVASKTQLGFMSVCKSYICAYDNYTWKWFRNRDYTLEGWNPFNTALVYMFSGPVYGKVNAHHKTTDAMSWVSLCSDSQMQTTGTFASGSDLQVLLSTGGTSDAYIRGWTASFPGSILGVPSGTEFIHSIPQYDSATWFAVVGISLAVILVTATVVTAVSVAVKKSFREYNAKSSAEVEKAWTALTNDPSAENAKAYNKIAFKHNLIARLTGGTVYDRSNYWGSSGSSPVVDGQSLLTSVTKADQCDTSTLTLSDIYYSITGCQ